MKRGEFVPRDLVVDLVVNAIGGFPIEIKTEIRYHIICCYHNFYLILVLISIGNPPIVKETLV